MYQSLYDTYASLASHTYALSFCNTYTFSGPFWHTASLNGDLRWKKRSSKLHNFDHFCTVQSHLCSILRFLTCAPSSHLWRFMGSQFSPSMATVGNFKMHFQTQPSEGKLFRMLPLTHQQTDWGFRDLLSSSTMLFNLSIEAAQNIFYK